MNKLLRKIEWLLRRLNLKFNLLDIFLHDGDACIGFTLFEFTKDFRPYAFLAFEFRLPNGTNRKVLSITNWDFLFLSTPLWNWVSDVQKRKMWTGLNRWDNFWYGILNKLYR